MNVKVLFSRVLATMKVAQRHKESESSHTDQVEAGPFAIDIRYLSVFNEITIYFCSSNVSTFRAHKV